MAVAFSGGMSCGLYGSRPLGCIPQRLIGVQMKGAPQVPFKYPGMDSPQWIDVFNRMYRERIMFMGQDIDDDFANTIIAVLLFLENEDRTAPVSMYMNVGGGVMKSGLAMYDTMQMMPYEIQTVNIGMCAQIAAFIAASGTKGKRFALPNARFMMQNPRIEPPVDNKGQPRQRIMQATEMRLEVAEVLRDKKRMIEGFASFTGQPIDKLELDFKRDFYLNAYEASQYGLIDQLLLPKRPSKIKSKADIRFGNFGGPEQRYQGGNDNSPSIPPNAGNDGPPPAGIY